MTAEAYAQQVRSLEDVIGRALARLARHEREVEALEARLSAVRSSFEAGGYLAALPSASAAVVAPAPRPAPLRVPRPSLATG